MITLTTDFGTEDSFVGVMKGVIFSICPKAYIVDITHGLPPQDILSASIELARSYSYFPKNTIHVVVVDPGVGTTRKIICVKTKNYVFLAPDNGVLSLALEKETIEEIYAVENPEYFLNFVSNTFHGRDIFAPVAAHIENGVKLEQLGSLEIDIKTLLIPKVKIDDEKIQCNCMKIDHFGNCMLNLSEEDFNGSKIEINGIKCPVVTSYGEVRPGELLMIKNSFNYYEISVNKGNAAKKLNLSVMNTLTLKI